MKKSLEKKYNRDKVWYRSFFQNFYLKLYKDIIAGFDSKKEAKLIADILRIPENKKILDLCGGHGRISIPLAKMGYDVYILDINKKFLEMAKKEGKRQKLEIKTIKSDMRNIPYVNEFDAVINIFTSFGYLETDKEDERVIKEVYKSLKPGGIFLIDIINGQWLKNHFCQKNWKKIDNLLVLEEHKLDNIRKRNIVKITIIDLKRNKKHITYQRLRLYSAKELKNILIKNKFKIIRIYGNLNKEKFSPHSSKRIVILAKKPEKK